MVDYDWNCKKLEGKSYYTPRSLSSDDLSTYRVQRSLQDPRNPLIVVTADGYVRYAKTNEQKIEMIRDMKPSSNLHWVWIGSYSSDNFFIHASLHKRILSILGYKTNAEKLEDLNAKVRELETKYQTHYRYAQRAQKTMRDLEESLLNAKTERDMLNQHLNPSHPDGQRWKREYEANVGRYAEPVADDNDYWH